MPEKLEIFAMAYLGGFSLMLNNEIGLKAFTGSLGNSGLGAHVLLNSLKIFSFLLMFPGGLFIP